MQRPLLWELPVPRAGLSSLLDSHSRSSGSRSSWELSSYYLFCLAPLLGALCFILHINLGLGALLWVTDCVLWTWRKLCVMMGSFWLCWCCCPRDRPGQQQELDSKAKCGFHGDSWHYLRVCSLRSFYPPQTQSQPQWWPLPAAANQISQLGAE